MACFEHLLWIVAEGGQKGQIPGQETGSPFVPLNQAKEEGRHHNCCHFSSC